MSLRGTVLVAALSLPACVALVGADEERESAVDVLCGCVKVQEWGNPSVCKAVLNERLDSGSPEQRASWLANFDAQGCASQCSTDCVKLEPTCHFSGDKCSQVIDLCCEGLECTPGNDGPTCQ